MLRTARLAALSLVLSVGAAHATDPAVDEVQQCARRNLPELSARQSILLESTDAGGAAQRLEADLLWRRNDGGRSQVRIVVDAPPDVRGTGFLLVERDGVSDMFSYLPELGRVRRLTGRAISGSLFGTDFSYEDIERLQLTAEGSDVERLPDTEIDGRPAYVVAVKLAPASGSAYERVVTYVDRETCVALQTDLESAPGEPAKRVTAKFEEVRQVGERWIPHLVSIEDKETGRKTTLTIRKIDLDVPLSNAEFTETALLRKR
jgi:hypothetical protein